MYSLRKAVRNKASGTYTDSYPYRITTILYNKTKILSIVTKKKPEQNFQIGIFYTPIQNVPCFFLWPLYFVFVPSRSNGVFVQLEQVLPQSLV